LQSLKNGDLSEALSWCNTHKTKLAKNNSKLEFKLRIQEFMELIKEDEFDQAIIYARSNFVAYRNQPE
jgi:hypothetical protein